MRVIDSHTEGEPTRVIVDGGPPLGDGPLAERRARFAREFDHVRRFAVNEPRGHDALVGALLCEPHDPVLRRRASSSSTTSAISACAATARSALP